jgi:hypothetical protein
MRTTQIIRELVKVKEQLPLNNQKRFDEVINRVVWDEFYIQKLIAWYQDDNDKDYNFEGEMMRLIQSRNGAIKAKQESG